jgi:hypothetical protein
MVWERNGVAVEADHDDEKLAPAWAWRSFFTGRSW